MDNLGGFSISLSGNCYFLVKTDAFTRYCELVPYPDKSGWSVAKAFKENRFDRHCASKGIVTDSGGEFNYLPVEEICCQYRIQKLIRLYGPPPIFQLHGHDGQP